MTTTSRRREAGVQPGSEGEAPREAGAGSMSSCRECIANAMQEQRARLSRCETWAEADIFIRALQMERLIRKITSTHRRDLEPFAPRRGRKPPVQGMQDAPGRCAVGP